MFNPRNSLIVVLLFRLDLSFFFLTGERRVPGYSVSNGPSARTDALPVCVSRRPSLRPPPARPPSPVTPGRLPRSCLRGTDLPFSFRESLTNKDSKFFGVRTFRSLK